MKVGRVGRRRWVAGAGIAALGVVAAAICWWSGPALPAISALGPFASDVEAPPSDDEHALFSVRVNALTGYIDRSGRIVIEPRFEWAGDFSEGLAGVGEGGRYGFIDRAGALVIPLKYTLAGRFVGSLAAVRDEKGRWGYIRPDGAWAIPPRFEAACDFGRAGRALVGTRSTLGKIKGLADASSAGDWSWRWIDISGQVIGTCPNMSHPVPEPGSLVPVRGAGGFGYQNDRGQFVIPPSFTQACPFSEGLAPVEVAGSGWGYIDPRGTMVIPPAFGWGYEFHNGLAMVAVNGMAGYIDRKGNWVWKPSE